MGAEATEDPQSGAGEEHVEVPLFVAATSPFTLVTFNSGDEPNFTLDEVNHLTYDHVKLCRTTVGLDPNLSVMAGMAAIVSYTGALLFPRMPGLSVDDVVAAANRLLLKMTFGGIAFDALAAADVGFGMIYGTGYFLTGGGANGPNYCSLMALQHRDAGSFDTMKLLHPRAYKASEIQEALKVGSPTVDEFPEISPSIFLNGLTYYQQYQLTSAIVFLWSTCESVIGRLWTDHVLPKGSGISGRKRFVEGNGWQAAYKVEVLFQLGLIDEALYADINLARTSRNSLAHRGETPGLDACKAALCCAFKLVSLARSGGTRQGDFDRLASRLASVHDPRAEPLEPQYWRELQAVPGDKKWGDAPYPMHPEIELKPLVRKRV